MKQTKAILIALFLGLVVGLTLNLAAPSIFEPLNQYAFNPLGQLFIRLIKMLVVPVVFISIVLGAAGLGDPKQLGRIGLKSISFFLVTTAVAISIAVTFALIIKPGAGGNFKTDGLKYEGAKTETSFVDTLLNIVPDNPAKAMADGNMLQIIAFAALIGLGLAVLGKRVQGVHSLLEQGNELMMYLVNLVMKLAPIGTFGLLASSVGKMGLAGVAAMFKYMIVVMLVLIIHGVFVYGGLLKVLAKESIIRFFKHFGPVMAIGFSTSSSNASLPFAMKTAQEKLGVPKAISSFVQPLGATINMDGTAIMQGVATVFIAQVYGVELTLPQLAMVVLTAVLASIGTAGVPGVGLVMLTMVLNQVNLPVEGIALIIGIDRILDMSRTAVNISGDAICAMIVAKSEEKYNTDQSAAS
ncbi:dicarboxylate/amino acid:cation symporter [Bacillus mycoides]|uniref:Proton/sodium-glutamate symporter protein n=2 Tax=Bacillus cereus group TaxID=86661 RepID=R8HSC2_BACCE|nr:MULTISPECIES: dicarboxylate/amino acid:cation symporter [Bacillus cereus group]EEL07210.1 Proton/sodium-glutamate symport protein (Glutamate-aspartate carrier protein) [Bacillus cereus BDRD-ST196]AIW86222.1 sodium:dicarboxylate symporter family protein [Bacillus mycoides]EOO75739.1 proton/sodium-glutamate symporter protein [Bacillus cereus VD021]MBE7126851.1 dicarboxylate/amino acid:cation symporter [Bacillus mycoides]MCQ6567615.1 dicarboxylate/amino acid:cation symporter [Bacillus mycoides